jgi:CubicO group peptidase (beta-lactamase class C family)
MHASAQTHSSTLTELVVFLVLAVLAASGSTLFAQQAPDIAGDYVGTFAPNHIERLHLRRAVDGSLTGTFDIPDQQEAGDSLEDIHLDGHAFSFAITRHYDGEWRGTLSSDGNTLTGNFVMWIGTVPMNFVRFVPAAKPSPVDGIWLANLSGGNSQRVQLIVKSDGVGNEFCTMDLPDRRIMQIECAQPTFTGGLFSWDIPAIRGHWTGQPSADDNALLGTWTQRASQPLNFQRQSVPIPEKPIPPPVYDPAIPPVPIDQLQSVLDRDLAETLKTGELAPSTGIGVSIGVVEHGVRRILTYGAAKPDSIFEIGSITKTFTGLMLAQMVAQGKARLDEPLRQLLPLGTVPKPNGPEITLLDLATRRSGLRWEASNFYSQDLKNPYADYTRDKLYAFMRWRGVQKRPDAPIRNSELAFGLLGQALADRAGVSYPVLVRDEIAAPLGLIDTTVGLSPEQHLRFLPGHDEDRKAAPAWDFDAMAGSGAIRSTASDMLTYLEANLHPETLKPASDSREAATLSAALIQSHQFQADISKGTRLALAWLYDTETGDYWHNGATGGFSAYALFNPKGDYAAVVLVNASPGEDFVLVDRLALHISQRLAGKPAISLAGFEASQ